MRRRSPARFDNIDDIGYKSDFKVLCDFYLTASKLAYEMISGPRIPRTGIVSLKKATVEDHDLDSLIPRARCIPWTRNLQMQISPSLFQLICQEYDLPIAFQYALLSRDKSLESTKGCFFVKDNSRRSDRFCESHQSSLTFEPCRINCADVFHKLQIAFNATLAICTIYDHVDDTIFHLVIGKVAYLQPWGDRVGALRDLPETRNPFGIHILLLHETYVGTLGDAREDRRVLVGLVGVPNSHTVGRTV